MPRRVDHEERRRQIADALVRTAATRGLHAAGMREVAAEAGVSLRLVQYYFGTKEELLLFAMQQLAAQFAERGLTRIRRIKQTKGTVGPASPRDVIAAILTEGLPVDDERRTFTIVYTAYLALSLTDPALAISPLVRNSNAVIDVVAAQLRAAQAVIDYHLCRLFPASRPALCPALAFRWEDRQVPSWRSAVTAWAVAAPMARLIAASSEPGWERVKTAAPYWRPSG